MRVRDLVGTPGLAVDLRVAADLDRPIRWVQTIEVQDPGPFLRGGEVVLTAGAWRAAGITPADFVRRLAEAGTAAVGYGLLPDCPEVPDGLVAAAERHRLACFVVPVEVPFIEITEVFIAAKRAEWEGPLRRHLAQHDRIVAALRTRRGVDAVLGVLAQELGLPVAVRSQGVVTAGEALADAHAVPLIGEGLADAELLLPRTLGELDVEQRTAVTQAMPFIALEVERLRAVRATELRYATELIDWAYAGASYAPSTATRLTSLGLPPEGPLVGVVVRGGETAEVSARLNGVLGADGVAVPRGGEVVAVCRIRGEVRPQAESWYASLGGGLCLGVGRPGSVTELRASLMQAAYAADAVAARSTAGWMTHDQLNSPVSLFTAQDPALVTATCRALLGPVLDHDARHGSELVSSLAAFLESGGRWQETAQDLHVHINTLRHRMHRVEEMTGLRLARTVDRVDLYLAVRALDLF
ncbi:PucR family transcriptional regulator [Streptomyces angustmyceticus]|uniref:PucR family transcriptional regulator n=1 Tax=Streptomyces angustmyceticus TaxID=285578 RepID=UPI003450F555